MRAGARVHDRVAVPGVEPRVVPAPAEVVALLVVGGGAEPGGLGPPVLELLEDDEALLPVGLVVVGAVERRAPVVHRVQEHVVEDDPAPLRTTRPWYTTRGSRPRMASYRAEAAAAVPPGTRPRSRSEVTSPASTSRARSPTRASRPGAEKRGRPGRLRHRASSTAPIGWGTNRRNWRVAGRRVADRPPGVRGPGCRPGRRSSPRGWSARQQVARADVAVGRHRQEQLALGEAEDRLVSPQELEVAPRPGRRRARPRR